MSRFLQTRDVAGKRVYDIEQDDGSISSYPSVTTILQALPKSQGLMWFERNFENAQEHKERRAMVGSTAHFFFESECAKQLPDHIPEIEKTIQFKKYLDADTHSIIQNINNKTMSVMRQNKFDPISLEQVVWSDDLGVAGRIDFFGKLNGRIAIVDMKTSAKFYDESKSEYAARMALMEIGQMPKNFFSKYAIQLSAYKDAIFERTGLVVEDMWIMRINEKNAPELRLMPYCPDDVKDTRRMFYDEFGF